MKAILLIPAPGDPHGLLTPGKCGAMPPIFRRCSCGDWACTGACAQLFDFQRRLTALVLAWDGEPVAEGGFRLALRMFCADSRVHGRGPYPEPAGGVRWFCGPQQEGVYLTIEANYPTDPYPLTINSRSSFNHATMGDLPALLDAPEGPLCLTWMLATAAVDYLGGEVVTL